MKKLITLFLLFLTGSVNAALITFEGHRNTAYTSPITRLGFDIGNPSGQQQHFHEIDSNLYNVPNGTGVLLNDRDTQIFVKESFGAIFSLTSVDVAGYSSSTTGLIIEGFLNNVSTGVINLASMGAGYTTLLGSTLGNIDRLVFDGIGSNGFFALDNLSLNEASSVPEPASLTLLGLGLAGIGFSRKKKTA